MGEEEGEEEEAAVTGVQDQCSNMSLRQWPYIHPFPQHWGSPQWFYWVEEQVPPQRAWWWCRFLVQLPGFRPPSADSGSTRSSLDSDSEAIPSRPRVGGGRRKP